MIESRPADGNGYAMDRLERLKQWAAQELSTRDIQVTPASEDASFRRYFRVTTKAGSAIAMDAPPAHEDCTIFVRVAQLFRAAGVNVPAILAAQPSEGFLLLTDFGSTTYLDALDADNADVLYREAIDALIRIQRASRPGVLPPYDRAALERELHLFPQWYLERHLGIALDARRRALLEPVFEAVLARNLAEARVFVHRDYHSRNLMVCTPNPGVLDFQDALFGPISYDLVSLFKDAYIVWPEERVLDWLVRYWQQARAAGLPVRADFAAFFDDFEWMGVQRHLKVLGIFARLWHRDGKDRYLAELPTVLSYVRRTAVRYRPLAPLARLLDELRPEERPQIGYTF